MASASANIFKNVHIVMFKTYGPVGEQPRVVVPIQVRTNLTQQKQHRSVSELVIRGTALQQGSQPRKRCCIYSTLIMNVKLMGCGSFFLYLPSSLDAVKILPK